VHVAEIGAFLVAVTALFVSAEILRRRGLPPDATRRYTHAVGACVAAVLPAFLSLAECVGLGVAIAAILAWTRARGLLRSVHGVERPTLGAVLFPLGLAVAAILGWTDLAAYALGALTFALADPAAALAGGRLGRPGWRVWRGRKSIAGSLAFAAVTVAIGLVAGVWGPLALGAVLSVAAALAVLEGVLGYGLDNLALPPLAVVAWRLALGV
jgi:phytol kinase